MEQQKAVRRHGKGWWIIMIASLVLVSLPFAGCATMVLTPIGGVVVVLLFVMIGLGKIIEHEEGQ